jgi:Excalibur calcium-binding domain
MNRLVTAFIAAALFLVATSPASAFRDRDCSDFPTQKKAQKFFKKHSPKQDPHGLDADGDGLACESNP